MIGESSSAGQPRISRETRRLLAAAALAFLALSVLARLRFPDQPPEGAVAPVLSQLTPRTALGDLASELASLRRRIEPWIVPLDDGRLALRTAADSVATWSPVADNRAYPHQGAQLDRPTGIELVRVGAAGPAGPPAISAPVDPSQPAFVIGTFRAHDSLAVEPIYLPTMRPVESAVWGGLIWLTPPDAIVKPGTFLFSTDAELVGLAVTDDGNSAIIPATTLLTSVRRLAAEPQAIPGWLGLEVQAVTPDVGAALGAQGGLVVSWVDEESPAAAAARTGDLISAINGIPASVEQWRAVAGRIREGETITLTVTRGEESTEQTMTAAALPPGESASSAPLGLTLRRVAGGSEVTAVASPSAAARAGLRAGDLIYLAGSIDAPTPAQVRTAYQAAPADKPLLIALVRGESRRVLALPK